MAGTAYCRPHVRNLLVLRGCFEKSLIPRDTIKLEQRVKICDDCRLTVKKWFNVQNHKIIIQHKNIVFTWTMISALIKCSEKSWGKSMDLCWSTDNGETDITTICIIYIRKCSWPGISDWEDFSGWAMCWGWRTTGRLRNHRKDTQKEENRLEGPEEDG